MLGVSVTLQQFYSRNDKYNTAAESNRLPRSFEIGDYLVPIKVTQESCTYKII